MFCEDFGSLFFVEPLEFGVCDLDDCFKVVVDASCDDDGGLSRLEDALLLHTSERG